VNAAWKAMKSRTFTAPSPLTLPRERTEQECSGHAVSNATYSDAANTNDSGRGVNAIIARGTLSASARRCTFAETVDLVVHSIDLGDQLLMPSFEKVFTNGGQDRLVIFQLPNLFRDL